MKDEPPLKIVYVAGPYADAEELARNGKAMKHNYSFEMIFSSQFREFYIKNLTKDKKRDLDPVVIAWKPSDSDLAICPKKGLEIKSISQINGSPLDLSEGSFGGKNRQFVLKGEENKTYKIFLKYNPQCE